MKSRGLLITAEGTEGAGKSTLIRLLREHLTSAGYRVVITREPGGSMVSEKIRTLIIQDEMEPWTEVFLYLAARHDHVQKTILPALASGAIVLCDRFTDSTLAYQSAGRGLPWNKLVELNRLATGGLAPDLTLFLDADVEQALARAKDPNRFERESLVFHRLVKKGFLKAGRKFKNRWLALKVDPSSTAEALAAQAMRGLERKLAPKLSRLKKSMAPR